ncbi:winged helix-turn-helix domain-containing protein [Terribacillus saccharophilus]|uniref:winged helix-turn-helix domain-containing protein n=1 Tax=Terribacillus saccharophilus TaxID=361277 RepID=UPI0039822330
MRGISFQSDLFQISYASEKIKLLPKEYELFQLLYQHPARIFSRRALLDRLWPMSDPVDRTVDDHIYRLRKKLAPLSDVVTIRTVRGQGYVLDQQSSSESNPLSEDLELADNVGKLFRKYHLYGQGDALRLMSENQSVFGVELDASSQLYLYFMNGDFENLLHVEHIDFWEKCYYLLHLHFYACKDTEKSLSYFTKALNYDQLPHQHKLEIRLLNRLSLLILTKNLDEAAVLLEESKEKIIDGDLEGFVLILYLMELGFVFLQQNETAIEIGIARIESELIKRPFSREKALFSIMQGMYQLYKGNPASAQESIADGFAQFRKAKYVPGIFQSLKVIITFLEEYDDYPELQAYYATQLEQYKENFRLTQLYPYISRELVKHL